MSNRRRIGYSALLSACMFVLTPICAAQSTLYVDDSAPPGGDGLSWPTAYNDLQDALDHDSSASTVNIRIAQGNYVPSELTDPTDPRSATFELRHRYNLRGGYAGLDGPDPDDRDPEQYVTVLNGDVNGDDGPDFENYDDNVYHVLTFKNYWGFDRTTLEGLTVRGGNGTNNRQGAGLNGMNVIVDVVDCQFLDNQVVGNGSGGAGIYLFEGFILNIENSVFKNNAAHGGAGGGIQVRSEYWGGGSQYSIRIEQSEFLDNHAAVGGAINAGSAHHWPYEELEINIEDSLFQNNTAGAGGGAIFAAKAIGGDFFPALKILDTRFIKNSGETTGGAISAALSFNTIMNSKFIFNESGFLGGGIDTVITGLIANCVFSGNSGTTGGAISQSGFGDAEIINTTIHGSSGGNGVHTDTPALVIANSILRNNVPGQIGGASPGAVAEYSNIEGSASGTNIDVDPMFVQPGSHNFRLHHDSPSRNAGDNDLLPADVLDMDGDGDTSEPIPWDLDHTPRVQDGTVDHGAYEGGHDELSHTASGTLDPGENLFLVPTGQAFNPLAHAGTWAFNLDGPAASTYEVTELTGTIAPGATGHHQLGTALDTQTDIPDGSLLAVLVIPFTQADLGGADPLSVNVTRYDEASGRWILAVAANVQNNSSTGQPIGERHVLDDPDNWMSAIGVGNYGVYWDEAAGEGYVLATVDRDGLYAFGNPMCPADLAPEGIGNDTVGGADLGMLLASWGEGGGHGLADLNQDGVVDGTDLGELIAAWGACESESRTAPAGRAGTGEPIDPRTVAPNWGRCADDDPCVGDLTGDRAVTGRDLGLLLAQWGDCPQRGDCVADLTGNGRVGEADLALLLGTAR